MSSHTPIFIREPYTSLRVCQDRSLTRREKQILGLVLDGMRNKEIASYLAISVRTVEAHRSKLMIKHGARSIVELINLAKEAGSLVKNESLV